MNVARYIGVVGAAMVLVSCGGGGGASDTTPGNEVLSARVQADDARYIVKFREGVAQPGARGRAIAAAHGGRIHHEFQRAMKGMAVTVPGNAADAFVRAMESDPDVEIVEPDLVMTASQTIQANAPWGLDRSDQRALPLSGTYGYEATGAGVTAYILDSGVRATHADFGGRVQAGYTAIADGYGTGDCHGHGTHVAGTVGGQTWGMAKAVSLVPVRVLGCDGRGYTSGIIAGIDWMIANASLPAVANMSLGGGASSTLDSAVQRAVDAGVMVAVAAGNSNTDACTASPARAPAALTVAATASNDARASYSNWGTCVDLFAPGSSITSASNGSDTGSAIMSGTSMASPHVAGLAALFLQSNASAPPDTVAAAIKSAAITGIVYDAGSGTANAMMHSNLAAAPSPAPAQEPTPGATISVASLAGSALRSGSNWRAGVDVTVGDSSGAPVAGAVVTADFSAGGTGLGCTTGSTGVCRITSGSLSKWTAQTQFTVRNISAAGHAYQGGANAASSILIARP